MSFKRATKKQNKRNQMIRYTSTPAIVAASQCDGIATLETDENILITALDADRRRQRAADLRDRIDCEIRQEERAVTSSAGRAEQLRALRDRVGETDVG